MSQTPQPGARTLLVLAMAALGSLLLGGCLGGSKDESSDSGPVASIPAPDRGEFPPAAGSLEEILEQGSPTNDIVVAPASSIFTTGENRFGFGVFNVDGSQVTDAEVAIYAQPARGGEVLGPFPASVESLETPAAFVAQTTSADPDAAKAIYVSEMQFPKPGVYDLAALIEGDDGELLSTRAMSIEVGDDGKIPDVGEMAPRTHTDTLEDVGNVSEIDTRVPAGTMHDVDFADALGEQPAVLLFATPALCQTQVCGPVVDIAEQVKAERPDDAAYIHQEIYVDNNPSKGVRPPLQDFGLRTEPWLFVVDADGEIVERIEGAFSRSELEAAIDRAQGA